MTLAVDSVRAELAALVGPSHVLADSAACTALAVDGKVPDCAVAPATAEQVAAVLRYASEHHLAVIPHGNGTKLSMGNPPRRYDVALSLRELNRVIHYEPADLTISVEAGMTFGEFQNLVGRSGLWLPLDPRGGAESSLGGIIAANAAGPLRQGFGGPRDMVLGLKIATTDGKVVKTGGRVVKNVAGYDFGKLLTGSFGTLGVIVEASLKLFPKPPERATFAMRAGTLGIARDLHRRIRRSPLDPMRLVLLDSTAAALREDSAEARELTGAELWIELGGSHRVIERCMLELRQLAVAVGATMVRREEAEEAWARVSSLADWLQPKYRDLTVLKAALPVAASEEFLSRAQQEAEADRIALASFAQVGVGIVHLCALQEDVARTCFVGPRLAPDGQGKAADLQDRSALHVLGGLVARLRQAARDLGGTLAIDHCPLDLKSGVDVWGAGGDDLEVMRKMKSAWDPQAVLSPGRFVGGI
ncbi:MAG TPA: FAD-binding oxidoreductase [Terriglobia bacterium]|nr:FAD-binding oxidoreductase [Terriglobia bacterium]